VRRRRGGENNWRSGFPHAWLGWTEAEAEDLVKAAVDAVGISS